MAHVVLPVFHLLTCLELYEGVREFPSFNFYSERVKLVVPYGPTSSILSPVIDNFMKQPFVSGLRSMRLIDSDLGSFDPASMRSIDPDLGSIENPDH